MTLFYKEEQPQEKRPEPEKEEQNDETQNAKPASVSTNKEMPADSTASPNAPANRPGTKPEDPVVKLEETEDQKQIAAARIARLRNLSFNMKNMENAQELESVPAYIRRNVALNDQQGSEEEPYSQYTVRKNEEGKQAEISTINTFLEGRKPD
jgi:cell division protein FtsZ